jgi:hypothetical protein
MAKFTPGPAVAAVSGSVGGTTFSRNTFGQYMRFRAVPVNPNTAAQTLQRDRIAFFAGAWRGLTQAQRDGWIQLAPSVQLVDALGQQYSPTGPGLYSSININRDLVGAAAVDTAPLIDSAPGFQAPVLVPDSGGGPPTITLNGTPSGETATNFFMIYATPPVSPGINFFKPGDYRFLGSEAGNVALPVDITTEYEAVYGQGWLTGAGNKISVKVVGLSDNGFRGTDTRVDALIL